ncbi:MAG: DUF4824 family protein [Betaproteobacteria bacterium]|nr:DUF4824 family protein [Betaproteobacteria bacterium]
MTVTWSRGRTLTAGLTLIALTNAIALGGVAWNRSGEPESRLTMTQRELQQPNHYRFDRDDGGMGLRLRWRVLAADPLAVSYAYDRGAPEWMDTAKLASLGFDVSAPPAARRAGRRYERQLPKDALLVLELDGPAFRKALERARDRAEKEAAKAVQSGKTGRGTPARRAAEFLKQEQEKNSRLFVVDAGPSAEALRAKYPDRTRYAIVRGKVRAYYNNRGKETGWMGYVQVGNTRVNVPLEFQKVIASAPSASPGAGVANREFAIDVLVAFGKRLEPWIVAARFR